MLSILIPTYNYNVVPLVKALYKQIVEENILFEIICFDNGSKSILNDNNEELNSMNHCHFTSLEKDVGRSKIRNLLAKKSKYDWLLFLDADVLPVDKFLIRNYLLSIDLKQNVYYGGLKYDDIKPSKNKLLRWVYGKSREEIPIEKRTLNPKKYFSSANFLIKKKIFRSFNFDENLTKYGHEDTLLALELVRNGSEIAQVDNPVYHLGLDENKVFLQKTRAAVENLLKLNEQNKITIKENKLLNHFSKIKSLNLINLIAFFYKKNIKKMEKNLTSTNPSLLIFDLYKMGYLCSITSN